MTILFSRMMERGSQFTYLLLELERETLVNVCHRLGYYNFFNQKRPGLFYSLRMHRTDEYRIAYRLFRLSLTVEHDCFKEVTIDGRPVNMNKGPGAILAICYGT